jgi:hypothetical protein
MMSAPALLIDCGTMGEDEIDALLTLSADELPLFELVDAEVVVYFCPEVLIEKGLSIELDIRFP